jgi:hypothetical protein
MRKEIEGDRKLVKKWRQRQSEGSKQLQAEIQNKYECMHEGMNFEPPYRSFEKQCVCHKLCMCVFVTPVSVRGKELSQLHSQSRTWRVYKS